MSAIRYTVQKAYRLDDDLTYGVPFAPTHYVSSSDGLVTIDPCGWLAIKAGFQWDGPSGPAIDTADFMRASCIHDALYGLMYDGLLDPAYRRVADQIMRRVAQEDGMGPIRAWYVYRAVRWFGGGYAKPMEVTQWQDSQSS
jgi:hypothetical protein